MYVGDYYSPNQKSIDSEFANEILMEAEKEMVEKKRFERIHNIIEYKSYMLYKDIPKNKEIFIYGFKHVETK